MNIWRLKKGAFYKRDTWVSGLVKEDTVNPCIHFRAPVWVYEPS